MGAENKKVRIDITLEASEALKKINDLNHELDLLGVELGYATKGTKEYDDISKRLVTTQNKLSSVTKSNTSAISANASSHKNSTNAINAEIQRLQALQRTLDVTSKEYSETTAAIGAQAIKMNQASGATGGVTSATMELSRVVSDAPYGIRGVANNLSQFTSQMYYASAAAGGLGKALKLVGQSLMGPLGVVFAITAAISLMDFFSQQTDKAAKAMNSLNSTFTTGASKMAFLKDILMDTSVALEDKNKIIAKASEEYEDLILELDETGIATLATQKSIDALSDSMVNNAKAAAIVQMIQKEMQVQMELGNTKNLENLAWYEVAWFSLESAVYGAASGMVGAVAYSAEKMGDSLTDSKKKLEGFMEMLKKNRAELGDFVFDPKKDPKKEPEIDNKAGKAFKENNLELEKEAQKHYDKMNEMLTSEEDKKLDIIHKSQRKELDDEVSLFVKKENIAYDAFVKKQEQRILDNATNKFIVDDANRLLAEGKVTHDGVIEESERQHQATMTNLKGVQAIESIKLTNKLAEDKEEHNRRMRDLDLELSAIIIEDGQVFQRYILDEQIKNQEADLQVLDDKLKNTAYMESLSYEERLALKEKFNEESLALEEMNAARAMSIEEAKQSMTQATWDLATKGLMSASKLAEKDSKEQKTLALLSIAAGTAEGLVNGILLAQKTADASPPGAQPFIFGAMLATQTASVLGAAAQAKSILNGGSASSSGGSSSSATVESFSPNFNVVGNSNENQLAQSIGNQANSPVQAFVVYDDIAEAESVTQQSIESSGI